MFLVEQVKSYLKIANLHLKQQSWFSFQNYIKLDNAALS